MFLFKRNRRKEEPVPELSDDEVADKFLAEHEYKMEHDAKYRESIEKTARLFEADEKARLEAGLKNKIGTYTFTCPNCGTLCKGEWVRFDKMGNLHGSTGCPTCNIQLFV